MIARLKARWEALKLDYRMARDLAFTRWEALKAAIRGR